MKQQDLSQTSAGTENLGSIFPHVEQLALNKEEYIRTLEMGIQLLQREIENLRQQRRPEHLTYIETATQQPDSKSISQIAKLIQSYSSSNQIIEALREFTVLRFSVIDCAMFLLDSASSHLISATETTSTQMQFTARKLEEEGITDWALKQKKTIAIPNIADISPARTTLVLAPLFLRGTAVGVFIVHSSLEEPNFEQYELNALTMLAESAAIAIDNIRSSSEISRMNLRLNTLNKQMLQSAKLASIGELAGSISHEINNPLQILVGHIQLLESGVGDSTRRLQIIKEQVYRIGDITRRLLDFARAVPADMRPEQVNLVSLIEDVLLFTGSQLRRDGIEIERDFEKPEPIVSGMKAQLEQVILNLVINARDAMPDGGKLTIAVFRENNKFATVSIADNGCGIASEHIEHIFDPFFSSKPAGKGTGLGLSISREIISQHNGTISVASELRKGTTFKISMPTLKSK